MVDPARTEAVLARMYNHVGLLAHLTSTIMMKRLLFALMAAACLSACRQPEGTIPQPAGEQVNKTEDISRDLLAVARRENGAVNDLRDDLGNLTGEQPPPHLVEGLSSGLETALAGKTVADDVAMKLATQLFVSVSARELSQRQIESLRKEVTATLTGIGVAAPQADTVATVVGEIQEVMTTNRRRWWHRG